MRLVFLPVLILLLSTSFAYAQDKPPSSLPPLPPVNVPVAPAVPVLPKKPEVGMHHVRVTDPKPTKEDVAEKVIKKIEAAIKDPNVISDTDAPDEKVIKAPAPKVYFTSKDDLKIWPKISALMAHNNTKNIDEALKDLETNTALVPPMGLFLGANAYTQRGDLKRAAELYYLAQLRVQFDHLRWPQNAQASRKTDTELFKMAELYGPPINSWVMADSKRLTGIIETVKKRDSETPYSYHPNHAMAFAKPEKDWPALHIKAREIFTIESQKIIDALKTLGR